MIKLRKYQKKGVKRIELHNGRVLLADDMGLGKTAQAVFWVNMSKKRLPLIVVCPAAVKYNWQRECATHFNLHAEALEGTKPSRMDGRRLKSKPIIIVNFDILKGWLPYLLKLKAATVIIDEIQYVQNADSQRTRFTRELAQRARYLIGLSGTPYTTEPYRMWSFLNMLHPERFPSAGQFGIRYSYPRRIYGRWHFTGARRTKELHKVLKRNGMIRRTKEQVLTELPPKTLQTIRLDIHNRREYDFAEKDLIRWVAAKYGNARARRANKGQAFLKSGYLKRLAARGKFRAVLTWVEDFLKGTDEKLAIYCIHKAAVNTLHKRFPNSVVINGSVPSKKRMAIVDKFQNDPKTRLFIGNINSAGIGLNLTAAWHCAIAEFPWTPAEVTQVMDRHHRMLQKHPVFVYFLVANGTVEERICDVLQERQQTFRRVMDGKEEVQANDLNIMDQVLSDLGRRR